MPEREYLVRASHETEKAKTQLEQEGEEKINSIRIQR